MGAPCELPRALRLLGAAACLCCAAVSLLVPWAQASVRVSGGPFAVLLPVDIGLTRCFGEVCQQHSELKDFLDPWVHSAADAPTISPTAHPSESAAPTLAPTKSFSLPQAEPTTTLMTDSPEPPTPSGSSFGLPKLPRTIPSGWIPKSVQSEVADRVRAEETATRALLAHFRVASFVAVGPLAASLLLSLALCLLPALPLWLRVPTVDEKVQTKALVLAAALLLVAALVYQLLTCAHLGGGRYLDGVWCNLYGALVGLLCAVGSAALGGMERQGYMAITDVEDALPSPHRPAAA